MSGLHRNTVSGEATIADTRATADQAFDIVLKPVSHPELGDIRINEELFAIGRTETPFASYAPELVADLSRRHARIFCEYGTVYIVDLGSKNGTTVNGADIRQKTAILRDGDEICLGGTLSYKVQLGLRVQAPARAEKLLSLTLIPEHNELGIQPIVVKQFPFLISKADEVFSRYKNEYPHQVNYISRRHAHIFLKGGAPFVEDLGSTNGTFVSGKRLDEHAVALQEGDVLAFGGHHFVYKVSLQKEEHAVDPTVTKLSQPLRLPVEAVSANADKTTFVAAADSFLDIFCVDQAQQQDEEINDEASHLPGDTGKETDKRPVRSKFAIFAAELSSAFAGSDRAGMKRLFPWGSALAALLAIGGLLVYLVGTPQRKLESLLASGAYAEAATVASQYLERHPDDEEFRALGTEAVLKANVPRWLAALKAGEFDKANTILADMKKLGRENTDIQPLMGELEWMGSIEQFIAGRGGVDAPVRIYVDEEKIKALLQRWNEDEQAHQRAFATITSYVPEFRDRYAETLSHLRKLQSDDAVYLAAMERLKTSIVAELNKEHPDALDAILKEYAEKYPRLGGLDTLRQDAHRYTELQSEVYARRLGRIVVLLERAKFSTPPFQTRFRALTTSSQFPPTEVLQQYQAVSKAWREGNMEQAFAGLQSMRDGPWADAAERETQRKKALADQFAALQKTRSEKGYEERLLSFYGALDPDEDIYFFRATEADVALYKDKALGRAQEMMNQAQAQWRQYRDNGGIEGAQRLDSTITNQFRSQARLLSESYGNARQALQTYTQLKTQRPEQWNATYDEIKAEAELQRKALLESRAALGSGLLKAKLALLGGEGNER
ncbi:MAG TPA: FHA domain-containing protein [Noviherbaspirillum sp.]|nr:FHA domain-containing protein [Noviherbaspirillum sp.]